MEQNDTTPEPWPGTKIIWEVGPDYIQPVTIVVSQLETGNRAWWQQTSPRTPDTQFLILDPTGTGPADAEYHGAPGPAWRVAGWREYGSYLIILEAGCYTMQVTWPSGGWQTTFAAGR